MTPKKEKTTTKNSEQRATDNPFVEVMVRLRPATVAKIDAMPGVKRSSYIRHVMEEKLGV